MADVNIIKRRLLADAFFVGFITLGTQIILLREFLLVYSNNELVIGLILALWMTFSAIGTRSFNLFNKEKIKCSLLRFLFLFLAFYPILMAFLIESLRNTIAGTGIMVSLWEIIIYSAVILFPLCFSGGFLFALINSFNKPGVAVKKYYSYEALGSMTSGALVSFYFIWSLQVNDFKSLEYLSLIILIYLMIHDYRHFNYKAASIFLFIFLGVSSIFFYTDINMAAKQKLYPGQDILETKESFQGNITVTKTGSQVNFFENNILLFSTGDVAQREEDIQYALLQRPMAENILIAGGGVTGTLNEVLKYSDIKTVDYIEQNRQLVDMAKKYTVLPDSELINFITTDPALFIKKTIKRYDAVFVNQPEPVNASLNRFYTVEFYGRVKKILSGNGILSTRLPYSENYQDDNELRMQASVYNSLKRNFKNVIVVPGKRLYFLASDSTLNFNFTEVINKLNLHNSYVNTSYINDMLLRFKSEQILAGFKNIELVNNDFKPVVYYLYLKHWLGFFKSDVKYFAIPAIIIVLLLLIFSKGLSKAVFTSGFTAASVEIILLIVFQIVTGNIYLLIGILVTVFMAGLATGSAMVKPGIKNAVKTTVLVQVSTSALLFCTAIYFMNYGSVQSKVLTEVIIFSVLFLTALFTGYQYGVVVQNNGKAVVSAYSADLFGAALGSFLPVIFLIPELGLYNTLLVLAILHLLALFRLKK